LKKNNPQVISYVRWASEMSPHSLCGAGQPGPQCGAGLCRAGQPALPLVLDCIIVIWFCILLLDYPSGFSVLYYMFGLTRSCYILYSFVTPIICRFVGPIMIFSIVHAYICLMSISSISASKSFRCQCS